MTRGAGRRSLGLALLFVLLTAPFSSPALADELVDASRRLERAALLPGLAARPGDERASSARRGALGEEAWLSTVRRLTADDFAGRGLGEPGLLRAATYLATQLRDAGVEPLFGEHYVQAFTLERSKRWRRDVGLRLGDRELRQGDDFVPLRFSASAEIEAPLVFVGYGLRAPEAGYDDYAGLEGSLASLAETGFIAVALRHEPDQFGDDPRLLGPRPLFAANPVEKARLAKARGARGLILVNDPRYYDRYAEEDAPYQSTENPYSVGIPAVHVPWAAGQDAFRALGIDLRAEQAALDADLAPRSRVLGRVGRVKVDLEHEPVLLVNVGGLVRGRAGGQPRKGDDVAAGRSLLLGAHYDHLGFDGDGPDFFPGADDNASGVAGVLALARAYAAQRATPTRDAPSEVDLAFVFFTGEEEDALGSAYLAEHMPASLGEPMALVNLDQIGRAKAGAFLAVGSGSAEEWPGLLDRSIAGLPLRWIGHRNGYAPSDQANFLALGLPVLHIFTGVYPEQHTTQDLPLHLNPPGAVAILRFATRLVGALERRGRPLSFRNPGPRPGNDGASYGRNTPDGGRGIVIGIGGQTADASSTGVEVVGVVPGSPAALAGVQVGDRITNYAGRPTPDPAAFGNSLRMTHPKHPIDVILRRGDETLTLSL